MEGSRFYFPGSRGFCEKPSATDLKYGILYKTKLKEETMEAKAACTGA
jgi:hypothetical protein